MITQTKWNIFNQIVILQLFFFIFFRIVVSAQENDVDTLSITIPNDSTCIINEKEILFTDLEKVLKNKLVTNRVQWAILKSTNKTIIFQDIVSLLTVLNKCNFKIKSEQPIIITGVYYYYSGGLSPTLESRSDLDKVIDFLNENKNLKIEIGVHTDSRGTTLSNMGISKMRAEKVIKYFEYKGIEKKRLTAEGYGEEQLLIKNAKTEKEHSINRRTEMKILY